METSTISSESASNLKRYRMAAIFFLISGLLFIVVAVVSGKIGNFIPVGIALAIISIGFWQRSKKLIDNPQT